jgi:hypothetical protein
MTFNNYVPPKTYAFLVKIAQDNKLSVKEVERIFVNKVAADLGFICDHERIGLAKKDPEHKPFCKDCWARMKTVKQPTFDYITKKKTKEGEYFPLETFLDVFYKEQAKCNRTQTVSAHAYNKIGNLNSSEYDA